MNLPIPNAFFAIVKSSTVISALCMTLPAQAAKLDVKTLKAPVPLYTLKRTNLYAIGESDTGQSITIVNGNVHIGSGTATNTAKPAADNPLKTIAGKLMYAAVTVWNEVPMPKEATDVPTLNELINKVLREQGYENPGTVPFLIKGKFAITYGKTVDEKADGLVLGYFTKTVSEGATPAFHSTMHFVGKQSRAIDAVKFQGRERPTLYIPR